MPAKLIPFERPPSASGDASAAAREIAPGTLPSHDSSARAARQDAPGAPPLHSSPGREAAAVASPLHSSPAPHFSCPRCGLENSANAYFCVACHQILIHRCPKCWHEQRTGPICENCRANMPLYWELELEKSMEEENRLWWARMWAAAAWLMQIVMLPFASVAGLARGLALRLIASRLASRLASGFRPR